jgi:hypothetical protein
MSPDGAGERRFLDFEAVEEPWNLYDLKDGTRLKVKLVMITILKEPASEGLGLGSTSKIVVGAMPPARLMGEPSQPGPPKEQVPSVAEDDIGFTTVQEEWNSYRLENGIGLRVKNVLMRVARMNSFDPKGVPIYQINTTLIVQAKVPKELEASLKGKK